MPTIQKRVRFRASISQEGTPVDSRSFQRESAARAWAKKRIERLEKELSGSQVSSKIKQTTSYRVMVRLRGHPFESETFPKLHEAKRWGQQTETAIREGRFFRTSEADRHTVAELIERFESEVLSLKPESKRSDQEHHLRWWRDQIGPRCLADVTPALLSEQRSKLLAETRKSRRRRSPSTANRYMTSLSHAFTHAAREWNWVSENPFRRVKKLPEPRGRVRCLSEDEAKRLLEACQESRDTRLYPLVVVALSTGARRGELLGLRWTDVDLDRGIAVAHHTKNNERRALPLSGQALEVLRDLGKVRRLDTDLVFADRRGRPSVPRKAWDKAIEAAEIEDFRFHDLRHTAASYLAMSGATLAEIAEVLGHKTLAMVKRYAHLTDQHTSEVVARMNRRFLSGH